MVLSVPPLAVVARSFVCFRLFVLGSSCAVFVGSSVRWGLHGREGLHRVLPRRTTGHLFRLPCKVGLCLVLLVIRAVVVVLQGSSVLRSRLLYLDSTLLSATRQAGLTARSCLAARAPTLLCHYVRVTTRCHYRRARIRHEIHRSRTSHGIRRRVFHRRLRTRSLLRRYGRRVRSSLIRAHYQTLKDSMYHHACRDLHLRRRQTRALGNDASNGAQGSIVVFNGGRFQQVTRLSRSSLRRLVSTRFQDTSRSILSTSRSTMRVVLVALGLSSNVRGVLRGLQADRNSLLVGVSSRSGESATNLNGSRRQYYTFARLKC